MPDGSAYDGIYREGPGYAGHVTDSQTNLTYMEQRYYDSVALRFLSPDPVDVSASDGGNFNRYWYGNNNPYRFVDPDGRKVRWEFGGGATLKDAVQTVFYLGRSPMFREDATRLIDSSHTYTFRFDRQASFNYDYSKSRTVTANPTSGLVVGSGEVQVPAIGFAHEVAHAAEHDRVGTEAIELTLWIPMTWGPGNAAGGGYFRIGIPSEEARATSVETNIANELGAATRAHYNDHKGPTTTCGPILAMGC